MPEGDNFNMFRRRDDMEIQKLFDDWKIDSAYADQLHVRRTTANARLAGDQREGSL